MTTRTASIRATLAIAWLIPSSRHLRASRHSRRCTKKITINTRCTWRQPAAERPAVICTPWRDTDEDISSTTSPRAENDTIEGGEKHSCRSLPPLRLFMDRLLYIHMLLTLPPTLRAAGRSHIKGSCFDLFHLSLPSFPSTIPPPILSYARVGIHTELVGAPPHEYWQDFGISSPPPSVREGFAQSSAAFAHEFHEIDLLYSFTYLK